MSLGSLQGNEPEDMFTEKDIRREDEGDLLQAATRIVIQNLLPRYTKKEAEHLIDQAMEKEEELKILKEKRAEEETKLEGERQILLQRLEQLRQNCNEAYLTTKRAVKKFEGRFSLYGSVMRIYSTMSF